MLTNRSYMRTIFLLALISLGALPIVAGAMKGPSVEYCQAFGHQIMMETTEEGEAGYCVLPGNQGSMPGSSWRVSQQGSIIHGNKRGTS